MLKLAVFGHPVAHSLSPRIHAHFGALCGIKVDYRAIDCPAGRLREALEQFRANGGCGCNLTVPLKAEGLEMAGDVAAAARIAGACNTLVWRDGGWFADNTDGAGLVADLARIGIAVAGRSVLVAGAGGAVAGVLGPLLDHKPAKLSVLNRDGSRAERLVARFSRPGIELGAAALADGPGAGRFDLLIQGTSLGHHGGCPAIDPDWLNSGAVAYDLNYGAAFAPFRALCQRAGLRCHSGLGMLVEQAALAFELFTGTRPETAPVHTEIAQRVSGTE